MKPTILTNKQFQKPENQNRDKAIIGFKPIEMPTEEEIEKLAATFLADEVYEAGFVNGCKWFRSRIKGVPKECPSPKSKDGKHIPASSDPEGYYCGFCGKDLDIKGEGK